MFTLKSWHKKVQLYACLLILSPPLECIGSTNLRVFHLVVTGLRKGRISEEEKGKCTISHRISNLWMDAFQLSLLIKSIPKIRTTSRMLIALTFPFLFFFTFFFFKNFIFFLEQATSQFHAWPSWQRFSKECFSIIQSLHKLFHSNGVAGLSAQKKGLKRIGKIFKKGSIRLIGKFECQRNGNSRLNFGFLEVNKVGF